jgi:hypothetical protein
MLRRTENAEENVDRNRNQEGGVMVVVVVAVMVMVFIVAERKGAPNQFYTQLWFILIAFIRK